MAGYEFLTSTGQPVLADFRSDTVTRATPAMRQAMATADVGDDVYGDDPTVNALQERVAELTGKEAALWMTTATESNLVALMIHCGRGDEFICGNEYHVYTDEARGASALGGAVACPLGVDENGSLEPDQVVEAIKEDDIHYPVTTLLSLQNTVHGSPQARSRIDQLGGIAHDNDLAVHLDGARLFDAAVALTLPISAFLDNVDTVTLCMSKGLGVPQGALLAGSRAQIRKALRLRKMVGGGVRQVGHLAAAANHALDHHVDRLADDHARAARLTEALNAIEGFDARNATNMVFVSTDEKYHVPLRAHLAAEGMTVGAFIPDLRIVCHLDIVDAQLDLLINAFASYER